MTGLLISPKHSRSETPPAYTLFQRYLKASKASPDRHFALSAQERWPFGNKLIWGAYDEHEMRSLIPGTNKNPSGNATSLRTRYRMGEC